MIYRDTVVKLVKMCQATSVLEIGVHKGRLTEHILKNTNASVCGVDSWAPTMPGTSYYETGDPMSRYTRQEQDEFRAEAIRRTQGFGSRCDLVMCTSATFAAMAKAREFDMCFLDGDHSADGVWSDICLFWPRTTLLFAGHDYDGDSHTKGVRSAVDKFAHEHKLKLNVEGTVWWVLKGRT